MKPLRIEARMLSRTIVSDDGMHLDSLLMAATARRDGMPALLTQQDAINAPPIEIPIALSPCGRFYLASSAMGDVVARENRYINRRFPLSESISMGDASVKRIQLSAGACKGFRVPSEASHVSTWTWYAVGDAERVRELLVLVTRLGKRRAVGEGLVREWVVEEVEPIGDGFPVLTDDGAPLRNLPLDVPGLSGDFVTRIGRLRPPYWLRHDEYEVACIS